MNLIDRFLDRNTMYRLALYYLIALLGTAMLLGALGIGAYSPVAVFCSVAYLFVACWAVNRAFARILQVPYNPESSYITALILALILTPPASLQGYVFLTAAAALAMASKYLLTWRDHNVFNPAAIAIVLTAYGAGETASWWIGSGLYLPVVMVGGILLVRKVQRLQMVSTFIGVVLVTIAGITLISGGSVTGALQKVLVSSPLFFLAFVMLTEPLTAPTALAKQRWYGALTGLLFVPQVHILNLYFTPELALVAGNVASYLMERKSRLRLTMRDKIVLGPGIADFLFAPSRGLSFRPGQYLELTLPHDKPDERGSRRYFTLASSPTEKDLRLGVKFYANGSTYKQAMWRLGAGAQLAAGQIGGDFVLPDDPGQKLVFIAGGIGITPFRSMIKYLADTRQARDIILIYAASNRSEFCYQDVFSEARQQIGLKVTYVVTRPDSQTGSLPHSDMIEGSLTPELIGQLVPDRAERRFYISGSHPMVTGTRNTLQSTGVNASQIVVDFFPGYA